MSQVDDKLVSGDGDCVLTKQVTLTQNSTSTVDGTITLPANSEILQVVWANLTTWDSATSATGTVGITSGGTEYVSGINAKTGGRIADTATAAQETNRANIGSNTTVHATVAPVGATTAGKSVIKVLYRRR